MHYAALIPAYKPSAGLVELVKDLAARGTPLILVVDDGSGPQFRALFDELTLIPRVEVLRHAANLGKGAALKTGINHALLQYPDVSGFITADADGQHHIEDIARVAGQLCQTPEALVLGARTFEGDVPARSRFGNLLTRRLVSALTGARLRDTQTGLRGIPTAFAAQLLDVEANGYEFELEMLLAARRSGVELIEIPIRTIYEDGNASSHFNPLLDSMKIYFVLLRFISASLAAALLDNLIFYLIWKRTGNVLGAQAAARVVSVVFNYTLVRRGVFASREGHEVVLPKYLLLVAGSGTASYLGIQLLHARLGLSALPAKLLVESILFFVNFAVQRMFIFSRKRGARAALSQEKAGRFYGWLLLGAVAALVAVEATGFRAVPIFAQQIWAPEGWARLTQFAAAYTAVATAVLILAPWLFPWLAVAAGLLLTTIFLGPLAVFAVALFLLSSWSLGSLVGQAVSPANPVSQKSWQAESPALPCLLGMAVYIFAMPFVARLPVNYWWSYALVLAVPIFVRRPHFSLPSFELPSWGERMGFAALLFLLIAHWFAMLKPEASADGLSMHLAVPVNIAANHMMTFEPSRFLWAVMPMGADFCYAIVYGLGGEMAARLLNFMLLLVLLGLLHAAVKRLVSPGAAWLVVALFACTPLVQLVTGSLFVENLLAALLLGMMTALWEFGEGGGKRYLYVAAALGGTAMATKVGALALIVPAILCAAVELWKRRTRWSLALALLLLTTAPPYAIAWWKTGSALFPFRPDKFHSRLLDPKADIQDNRFRQPLSWNTPYDLTFHTNRYYEGQDGSFGFQFFWLAPFAVLGLLVAVRRQTVGATVVAATAVLSILSSEPNARYLYPALPLLFVPFAGALGWAATRQRTLWRVLLALMVASIALNVYFLPGSSYYHKDFYGPFTQEQREAYMSQTAPVRDAIAWLNRTHPQATVLFAQDSELAGLGGEIYENHWHQFNTLNRIRHTDGVPALRALLAEWKIEYILASKPTATEYARPKAMRDLLDECTVAQYANADVYVAHLETTCRGASAEPRQPVITVKRGDYDDFDPAILLRGDWERTAQFAETFAHTVTFTDTPGAEIALSFQGGELTYVFTRAPNRGKAQVTIDGRDLGTLDLYAAKVAWRSRARFGELGPGRHVLLIRVLGESRPEAEGKFVDVDGFEVR